MQTDNERIAKIAELVGPDGWAVLGELAAAIEAKGWEWGSDYFNFKTVLLDTYWVDVRVGTTRYRGRSDNLPEAVKLAVLAALDAEA